LAFCASLLLCASSVSAVVTPLVNLAGESVSVLILQPPSGTHTLPWPLSGEPTLGYAETIPFTRFFGPGSPSGLPSGIAQSYISIDTSGAVQLNFPAGVNANAIIFDGAEIKFNNDNPLPFFVQNYAAYSNVQPGITVSGDQTLCHTGDFAAVAPVLIVQADGSVSVNIKQESLSLICGVTYQWGTSSDVVNNDPTCTQTSTCGDPQFIGFVGQSYQIHGVSGTIYNVLSTPQFQLNALFTYLESGKCRKGTMCFSHPGNYFGEVGMLFMGPDGVISRLRVVAGPLDSGMKVFLNETALSISTDAIKVGDTRLVLRTQFELEVQSPEYTLRLTNSDMFLNQDIAVNAPLLKQIQEYKQGMKRNESPSAVSLPHGLLGQTWEYKTYSNRWKFIQGQLFDYVCADGIFGTSFNFNRFGQ